MLHEEEESYALHGCSLRCGGFGFAFIQSRWLVMYWFGRVMKVEVVPYLLWCAAWCMMLFVGWLSFAGDHGGGGDDAANSTATAADGNSTTILPAAAEHHSANPFTPGHIMFDLFVLVSLCYVFGNLLSSLVALPPLFGYMVVGMFVRNFPGDPTSGISDGFSAVVKEIALAIIVCRAGLGLPVNTFLGDVKEIRRMVQNGDKIEWHEIGTVKQVVGSLGRLKTGLLLAVTPMTFEAAAYAGLAVVVFKFNIIFGFLLGFVMAAVSPAVVVPGLIDLQSKGFVGGTESTAPVPSIVMFASGLDDIFAITLFGIFLGMSFGGGAIAGKLVKAPLEILGGFVIGFLLGVVLYIIACRLVPKEYNRAIERERQVAAGDRDLKTYGMAHFANPYVSDLDKIPVATKSHQLIFFLVFISCVAFVIGTAAIKIGDAGSLSSLGVLGAMSACLGLNFKFSQADFRLATTRNNISMLELLHEAHPEMANDAGTRRFFGLSANQNLIGRLADYRAEAEELENLTGRHAAALSLLNLHFKIVWDAAACPLLFALVGRSIVFSDLFDPELLPKALLVIAFSLLARCAGAVLACTGSGWCLKNKFFVALAWLPKATVQAAVGGLALAEATPIFNKHCSDGRDSPSCLQEYQDHYDWSQTILRVSVIGIIITAPLGSAAIAILGPKWLAKRDVGVPADAHAELEVVPPVITPNDPTDEPPVAPTMDLILTPETRGLSVQHIDSGSVLQFMHRQGHSAALSRSRQTSLINLTEERGVRPAERAKNRVKRSASFPCSLAMENPRPPTLGAATAAPSPSAQRASPPVGRSPANSDMRGQSLRQRAAGSMRKALGQPPLSQPDLEEQKSFVYSEPDEDDSPQTRGTLGDRSYDPNEDDVPPGDSFSLADGNVVSEDDNTSQPTQG